MDENCLKEAYLTIEKLALARLEGFELWQEIPLTTLSVWIAARPGKFLSDFVRIIKITGDDFVSGDPVRIYFSPTERCYMLSGSGTTNATFLNGERIENDNRPYPLKDKDLIGLAKVDGEIRVLLRFRSVRIDINDIDGPFICSANGPTKIRVDAQTGERLDAPKHMGGANGPIFSRPTEIPDDVDRVHFSVTSPRTVQPGTSFVVDVWAHMEKQRKAVVRRAQEETSTRRPMVKSKGPILLARGSILTVRIRLVGLVIDVPEDIVLWDGEIGNASFLVNVPADIRGRSSNGVASIHMNGMQITRIYFIINLGRRPSQVGQIRTKEKQCRSAFASYASADRDEVLARIQGIQKVAPRLRVFFDVISLRSGEDWRRRLWEVIPQHDIFYLFWSGNARKSQWVEEEWRCALKTRGLDFIDPVPLVSPEEVPPPPELAGKHFGDWILALTRARK